MRSLIRAVAACLLFAAAAALPAVIGPRTAHAATTLFSDSFAPYYGWVKDGEVLAASATDPYGNSDGSFMQDPSILQGTPGAAYKMWYSSINHIGYADSADGVTWKKENARLMTNAGIPDESVYLVTPSVRYVTVNGVGIYTMVYAASAGNNQMYLKAAWSTSPDSGWTRLPGILLQGSDFAYEMNFLYDPALMWDNDQHIWKLWYVAGRIDSAGGEPKNIAYATSTVADPRQWNSSSFVKYNTGTYDGAQPMIAPLSDSSWAGLGIGGPNVRKAGPNDYWMRVIGWAGRGPARGGVLHSSDGLHWTLTRANLDLDLSNPGTARDDNMVYRSQDVDNGYTTIYNGKQGSSFGGWVENLFRAHLGTVTGINPANWTKACGTTELTESTGASGWIVSGGAAQSLGSNPSCPTQTLQGNQRINTPNYSVSADITPTGDTTALRDTVLIAREQNVQDPSTRGNYYYGGISSWGSAYAIGKFVNNVNTELVHSAAPSSAIAQNSTHHITLTVSGSTIQLYDNGVLELTTNDSSLAPSSSYIGINVVQPTAVTRIANVVVTSADGPAANYIQGQYSGNCVDDYGWNTTPGATIDLWPCSPGQSNQQWVLTSSNGYYQIRNVNANLCLDDYNWATSLNSDIRLWTCTGNQNQDWTLIDQGNGWFSFQNRYSDLCMDNWNYDTSNGARLSQNTCLGNAVQLFKMTQ